ncbi:MAG: hypothetical protein QM744_12900 [Mesorhizobium sp.]
MTGGSSSVESRVHKIAGLIFTVIPSGAKISKGPRGYCADAVHDWLLVYQKASMSDKRSESKCAMATVKFQFASDLEANWNLGGDMMIVQFPRATFKGLETHIEAICGGAAEFAANALLSAYLESLWNCLAKLTHSEQLIVEAVTNKLIRSCIMRAQDSIASASAASRNKLELAKQYIDERITQPSLTVENVQNWLGISRRQLYSLFESYGGVARYIMSQRLKRCHVAINDPAEQRPIGRIAEQYGIDPTRVAGLFRQEFGYGPDQARSGVQYGQARGTLEGDAAENVVRAA